MRDLDHQIGGAFDGVPADDAAPLGAHEQEIRLGHLALDAFSKHHIHRGMEDRPEPAGPHVGEEQEPEIAGDLLVRGRR